MKTIFTLIAFFILSITNAQNVNIPDANFKTVLLADAGNLTAQNLAGNWFKIDANSDGEIQVTEALQVSYLNVYSSNISSLAGIENFTALKFLGCAHNQLTVLNVSNNTALEFLYCDNNQLTALNISSNTALKDLRCYNNQLTALDVSQNTALIDLYCYNNQLITLDFSQNTALEYLSCEYNQLTTLNISQNTALEYLYCANNQLTTLNVSQNTALISLSCSYNNQLTALDVSQNTALEFLFCYNNNQLTSLNVKNGNNTSIVNLNAKNNPALTCILVDNTAYSNANWSGGKDPSATFSDTSCATLSTNENAEDSKKIELYPTYVNDFFQLKLNNVMNKNSLSVSVFDSTGGKLKQYKNLEKYDVSGLAKGIYYITITDGKTTETRNIIKK